MRGVIGSVALKRQLANVDAQGASGLLQSRMTRAGVGAFIAFPYFLDRHHTKAGASIAAPRYNSGKVLDAPVLKIGRNGIGRLPLWRQKRKFRPAPIALIW